MGLRPFLGLHQTRIVIHPHAHVRKAARGILVGDQVGKIERGGVRGALDDRQWAVLRYADAMTRDVAVPQSLFDDVKNAGFNNQEIVELTATVASYNLVSRFLVALDIGEQNDKQPEWAIIEN